jgi:hypothetical protein
MNNQILNTLYHYCPTSSFYSIVGNRQIWLTSLLQSNDYMEGRLASRLISKLAQKNESDSTLSKVVLDAIQSTEESYNGLGFCLSEEPDLLSQWRGYANDATGVAIGFSTEYLNWLAENSCGKSPKIKLSQVIYDKSIHDTLAQRAYELAKQFDCEFKKIPDPVDESIMSSALYVCAVAGKSAPLIFHQIFNELFLLKSETFKEEREWRLISSRFDNTTELCSYRLRESTIIPYYIAELVELNRMPILEVVLGPKHQTPINIVKNFLKNEGFGDVKVIQSKATYR